MKTNGLAAELALELTFGANAHAATRSPSHRSIAS